VLLVGIGIDATAPTAGQPGIAGFATESAVQLVQTGIHAGAGTAKFARVIIAAADIRIRFVYCIDTGAGTVANVARATIGAVSSWPVGAEQAQSLQPLKASVARLSGRGVVVNVRQLGMVLLLGSLAIVVAVSQFIVVVGVGMPVDAVLNLAVIVHVMGDVPVIVLVGHRRVGMLGLPPFALGVLLVCHLSSLLSPLCQWYCRNPVRQSLGGLCVQVCNSRSLTQSGLVTPVLELA
jgi:hypothetical protein